MMELQCPIPIDRYPVVTLAHGGGGRLMHQLVDNLFRVAFGNPILDQRHDGATLELDGPTAFTTDSYVIRPLFFPGGDIGRLAVIGTVNDLAMCGALPRYLSCGFILEEGLPMETLWQVACSMREAARICEVSIVTGDTKVIERARGDGLYINTAGIGTIRSPSPIRPSSICPGDAILISGDIGRHGMAVMSVREGFTFESDLVSDLAPLHRAVGTLLDAGIPVHSLRDATRGGLASALVESARDSGYGFEIDARSIPIRPSVRAACEVLGLDPLHSANEGCMIGFVPDDRLEESLRLMRAAGFEQAQRIGQVREARDGEVRIRSELGSVRILDLPAGELLPRIC